jgi:AcrR family transcriptional regulator/DNA-binding MarR family transcriptional regulator
VQEMQRARMIAATIRTIESLGAAPANVSMVIDSARTSRKTFYDVFSNREDCLLAVFEQAVGDGRAVARAAYAAEPSWRAGMRAAMFALLVAIEREPAMARFVFVEPFAVGPRLDEAHTQMLSELASAIDRGRAERTSRDPPPLTARATAGAVAAILHARLLRREHSNLVALLAPLMSMIVLPYLGPWAARAEISVRAPPAELSVRAPGADVPARTADVAQPSGNPLAHLDMRLTYRTVQVLRAIAEHPEASNRDLAVASGNVDGGQISRLLKRVCGHGLIENVRPGRGESNAWALTDAGVEVERCTRTGARAMSVRSTF